MAVDFGLVGKTALVTGASRGIGRSIALAFAAAGADVALLARDRERLDVVAAEVAVLGRRAVVVSADVLDRDATRAACAQALAELGHLDVVVNNAGGNSWAAPLLAARYDGWTKAVRLNLDSTVHVLQALGEHLVAQGSGSVINVGSVSALRGAPMMSHYAAAKAALMSLTATVALEWASSGVRVNALLPGWVETDLTAFARNDERTERALLSRVPMGRWATGDEIAGPALFLASPASGFMTGATLIVDGGLNVNA